MFNKGLGEDYGATQGGGTGVDQLIQFSLENEHDYIGEGNITDLREEEEQEEAVNDGLGVVDDRILEQQDSNGDSFGRET